jgi:hypothetical protein
MVAPLPLTPVIPVISQTLKPSKLAVIVSIFQDTEGVVPVILPSSVDSVTVTPGNFKSLP